jgi:hypothetical protein
MNARIGLFLISSALLLGLLFLGPKAESFFLQAKTNPDENTAQKITQPPTNPAVGWETMPVKKLPVTLHEFLPADVKEVRSITGSLRKELFPVALDGTLPTLTTEALLSDKPAILLSTDNIKFALVYKLKMATVSCPKGQVALISVIKTTIEKAEFRKNEFCERPLNEP